MRDDRLGTFLSKETYAEINNVHFSDLDETNIQNRIRSEFLILQSELHLEEVLIWQ